ncbi:hypothetical protein [Parvibaculum sp.]|uniref:hypothetical protein n=1 Tax=Parvibaculum sp. TaxID=2024848 RepID=UPI001D9B2B6A|nr:hypothetical protein [Parvibaculum sp.]MBX3488907.1 hypothetical protein [Parvibaculum sp.]
MTPEEFHARLAAIEKAAREAETRIRRAIFFGGVAVGAALGFAAATFLHLPLWPGH